MKVQDSPYPQKRMGQASYGPLRIGRDGRSKRNQQRTVTRGAKGHAQAILARNAL